MILGVGIDSIEIPRVQKACEKNSFLRRCFTKAEIQLFENSPAALAGNFAVKEAVAKAMGVGFRRFRPDAVEVLRDRLGKPYVILRGEARAVMEELRISRFHVSITNTKEMATAIAIAEGETQ